MSLDNNLINKNLYKNIYFANNNSTLQPPEKTVKEESSEKLNLPVIATTISGTVLSILVLRKLQGKALEKNALNGMNFAEKAKTILKSFNIEYGLNEMLFTSAGSILGGLAGGLIFNKNENKKSKVKESVFQFNNIAVPTIIIAGLLKLSEQSNKLKGVFPKIVSVMAGIGAGMPLAAMISNKINNIFIDKNNQDTRKLRIKDSFVHVDDVVGALVLAKIPFANKLHADKILPVLYATCGYEAGTKK